MPVPVPVSLSLPLSLPLPLPVSMRLAEIMMIGLERPSLVPGARRFTRSVGRDIARSKDSRSVRNAIQALDAPVADSSRLMSRMAALLDGIGLGLCCGSTSFGGTKK